MLTLSSILLSSTRSIRCLRNIIHWNLITAFILRNATWFVVQLTMNPKVHESNVVSTGKLTVHPFQAALYAINIYILVTVKIKETPS
jgi:hypothetical protein